jgi:hypothetical protein
MNRGANIAHTMRCLLNKLTDTHDAKISVHWKKRNHCHTVFPVREAECSFLLILSLLPINLESTITNKEPIISHPNVFMNSDDPATWNINVFVATNAAE